MKRIRPLTTMALTFLAISIAYLSFDDLSWENNIKSYIGLMAFAVLLIGDIAIQRTKKSL